MDINIWILGLYGNTLLAVSPTALDKASDLINVCGDITYYAAGNEQKIAEHVE